MTSPYSHETKRGMEETIEAINRTASWASRIDTRNGATELDTGFIDKLTEEEERLRFEYKTKTTEIAVDNFVANERQAVQSILCGDLDEKVSELDKLSDYISEQFGYVQPLEFDKEELLWLVSTQVQRSRVKDYNQPPVSNVNLDEQGTVPEPWENQEYPIHN